MTAISTSNTHACAQFQAHPGRVRFRYQSLNTVRVMSRRCGGRAGRRGRNGRAHVYRCGHLALSEASKVIAGQLRAFANTQPWTSPTPICHVYRCIGLHVHTY